MMNKMSTMTYRNLALVPTVLAFCLLAVACGGATELSISGVPGDQNAIGDASDVSARPRRIDDDDASAHLLRSGLRAVASRDRIPRPVIEAFIRLQAYQIDLEQPVVPGDSFTLLYARSRHRAFQRKPSLMAGVLTVGGTVRKLYRFKTGDGAIDYYDEDGKSAQTSLLRKPMSAGIMQAGFGLITHPILAVSRMHTGVDWAAPTRTPIFASGNGTIEKIGREGGYGKYIRIRHAHSYQTTYSHLSKFALRLVPGARVWQGEVIGYVGSSGLSTGPHLHYEFLVNGRLFDPMRVRLPRARVLSGAELAAFERERDRLDAMLADRTRAHTF
jgi:murein DD-endopeptidase MepM/ murein hydrolase activator NlpD